MEFSAVAADLAEALSLARSIVPARTTIPVFNNVRIRTERGGIVLGATDSQMDVILSEPCEIIEDGETTINANLLFSLVKSFPSKDMVTIKSEGDKDRVSVFCGKSRFSLSCLPVDGFPAMPSAPESAMSFTLPVAKLVQLFNATKNVTLEQAQDRYYLQGVCIHTTAEHLVFVAANGQQLARMLCDKPIGFSSEIADAPIVPNAAVKAIGTILAAQDNETSVTLRFTKYRVWMTVGAVTFSAKLIDGTFLEYPKMVPMLGSNKTSFRVQASDLAAALNRLKIVYMTALEIKAPVAVFACADGGGIDVAAGKISGDNGIDFVAAEIVERMPQFAVSPQYLAELVGLWPATATLNVYSANPSSAVLIWSDSVPEMAQCVMPMKAGSMVVGHRQAAQIEAA